MIQKLLALIEKLALKAIASDAPRALEIAKSAEESGVQLFQVKFMTTMTPAEKALIADMATNSLGQLLPVAEEIGLLTLDDIAFFAAETAADSVKSELGIA